MAIDLKGILVTIAILIVCYVVYDLFIKKKTESTILHMQDARKSATIPSSEFPTDTTSDFTYSIWLYVNDWNYRYGENKVILRRINASKTGGIAIGLDPELNNLKVLMAVYPGGPKTEGRAGVVFQKCWINNIPLQRWTNIIVTVNSRAMDLYLDGKLVRTCIMPGVPRLARDVGAEITPEGGFSGFVSNIRYLSYSVNPSEAYNIYKKGYGSGSTLGNMFNKYRIKISLLSDNAEVNSFEI
jgi:hypothetical protein